MIDLRDSSSGALTGGGSPQATTPAKPAPQQPVPSKEMHNKLPCIHGLRAIAILFVISSHAQFTISETRPFGEHYLFALADTGVFIFFILSGFLITYLLMNEYATAGTINLRKFYMRRVLRIFPAFYFYLLVLALLSVCGILPIALSHFMDAAFFVWNYKHLWDPTNGLGNWFLGHFWTLSLEEQFYLLWPLTLLFLKVRNARRIALLLIVVTPLIRLASYFMFPESRGQLMMMLHTGSDSLMFGCLLAMVIRHDKTNAFLERFKQPVWPVAAALFVCVFSPLIAACLPGHLEGGYTNTLGRTLAGFSIAFVIAWLLKYPDCVAGKLLNSKWMVHIGVLSYSLYLWQQLFLTPSNKTWTGEFPFNLICAYAAALACYYLIEKPFLSLKRHYTAAGQNP